MLEQELHHGLSRMPHHPPLHCWTSSASELLSSSIWSQGVHAKGFGWHKLTAHCQHLTSIWCVAVGFYFCVATFANSNFLYRTHVLDLKVVAFFLSEQ